MCVWVCAYRLESKIRKNLPFCCLSLHPLFWIISWLTGTFNPFGTKARIKARSASDLSLLSPPYRISDTKELQQSTYFLLSSDHRQMFTWVKTCITLWELRASGKLRTQPEITRLKGNTTSLRLKLIPQQNKYINNQHTPRSQGEKKKVVFFLYLSWKTVDIHRERCTYISGGKCMVLMIASSTSHRPNGCLTSWLSVRFKKKKNTHTQW